MDAILTPSNALLLLLGLAGLGLLVLATRWATGRMKAAELDALRERLAAMAPTDPQYNTVRALYAAMLVGAVGSDTASSSGTSKSLKSDSDGSDGGGGDGGD